MWVRQQWSVISVNKWERWGLWSYNPKFYLQQKEAENKDRRIYIMQKESIKEMKITKLIPSKWALKQNILLETKNIQWYKCHYYEDIKL